MVVALSTKEDVMMKKATDVATASKSPTTKKKLVLDTSALTRLTTSPMASDGGAYMPTGSRCFWADC